MKTLLLTVFILALIHSLQVNANCNAVAPSDQSEPLKFCSDTDPRHCPDCIGGREVKSFFISPPLSAPLVFTCNSALNNVVNLVDLNKHADTSNFCPYKTQKVNRQSAEGKWLTEYLNRYPKNCGYQIVSSSVVSQNAPRAPAYLPKCSPSMCTSATFYAISNLLQKLNLQHRLPGGDARLAELTNTKGLAYKMLNEMARPDEFVKEFKLGVGTTLSQNDLQSCSQKGWPHEGDIIQLWRKDGTGHSAIFEGMMYDSKGAIAGLCYFTSNKITNGFAKRCEDSKNIKQLIVGRINL